MNDEDPKRGMSPIVKEVTRWLKPFLLLFGCYVVLYGHLTPGGGFAGGVIVACAFVLLTLAVGRKAAGGTLSKNVAAELDSVGALIFLGVALVGMVVFHAEFFKNAVTAEDAWFRLLSGGLIPASNIGIGLKVGMSLFVVFTILSAVHVAVRNGERKMIHRGRD